MGARMYQTPYAVDLGRITASRQIIPPGTWAHHQDLPIVPEIATRLAPWSTAIVVDAQSEIVAQGADATHCYLVVSGCVRTVTLLEDGRRQVPSFLFSGDLFGWEALEQHEVGAEAVSNSVLHRYARQDLEGVAELDLEVARWLRAHTAKQLRMSREHMLRLGCLTAAERIAGFLLDLVDRMGTAGNPRLQLPMGRRDIANHLCLTAETVSRVLTQFCREGTLSVKCVSITVHDRDALVELGNGALR